eukprot:m.312161 g.312161  ORF g.312161 m.312161 type:complete len:87 (+) comp225045_c0_seq1:145-405(+)
MKSTPAHGLPIEISMLTINTEYEIVMEALNSDGNLENSTRVTLKTNLSGPPAKVILNQANIETQPDSSQLQMLGVVMELSLNTECT